METTNRLRPVFVLKVLYECTDENHCMTLAQILKVLKEQYGIESYRKTVKEDIDHLIQAGFDIEFVKSSQNQYHVLNRDFDIAELKVLIDAVVSSKFICKDKSTELSRRIAKLAGPYMADQLTRNIDVEHRVKGDNHQLLLIVDSINTAINEKKKIAFRYFSYNVKKEKKEKHNGYTYVFSPYQLVWNGDFYYVVGFSDKYQSIGSFRVDRISATPKILEEDSIPIPKGFDITEYLNSRFRMYNGNIREVELICSNDTMDAIVDRFGEDIKIYANDMESFRIIVSTAVSHVFYSWVFGFDGKVKIKKPEDVKEEYSSMVARALSAAECV